VSHGEVEASIADGTLHLRGSRQRPGGGPAGERDLELDGVRSSMIGLHSAQRPRQVDVLAGSPEQRPRPDTGRLIACGSPATPPSIVSSRRHRGGTNSGSADVTIPADNPVQLLERSRQVPLVKASGRVAVPAD
jgi:hypothetical protein